MDFSSDIDKLEEGLVTVAKNLLQHDVTSFCPTIVMSSQQSYNEVICYKEFKWSSKHKHIK